MDVVTHHTTVAGDFAMTCSRWLITGRGKDVKTIEIHHHGMEVHRKGVDGSWYFFLDHPSGADPTWAIPRPPATKRRRPPLPVRLGAASPIGPAMAVGEFDVRSRGKVDFHASRNLGCLTLASIG